MSKESMNWLNTNILVGYTSSRGRAWWDNGSGADNHFDGPVPIERARKLLDIPFRFEPVGTQRTTVGGANDGEVTWVTDPDKVAVVHPHTGDRLGYFKPGFEIHQYNDALLDNVATILDDTLQIGSVGLLSRGGVAWVSVEVPENITTPEGVVFRPHLLAATSVNGQLSTTYKRVVTNVECDNTMGMALAENGQAIKIKHSKYSQFKVVEARAALNIIHTIAEDFAAEVKTLCEVSVSDAQWSAFLDAHAPVPEDKGRSRTMAETKREELTQLWKTDARVAPWTNTGYGVLQAVNTHDQWFGSVRGKSREERNWTETVKGSMDKLDGQTLKTLDKVLAAA